MDNRLETTAAALRRRGFAAECFATGAAAAARVSELAADAKKKLREAKKAQIREKIVKKGEEIREEFNKLYSK